MWRKFVHYHRIENITKGKDCLRLALQNTSDGSWLNINIWLNDLMIKWNKGETSFFLLTWDRFHESCMLKLYTKCIYRRITSVFSIIYRRITVHVCLTSNLESFWSFNFLKNQPHKYCQPLITQWLGPGNNFWIFLLYTFQVQSCIT